MLLRIYGVNVIISIDDGSASDMRVAELAKKHNLEAVFYIPVEWAGLNTFNGREPLTFNQVQELADNFELGSHGITHRHLTSIPYSEAVTEIVDSKKMLENLFNVKVTKFCPSRGYLNDELIKVVEDNYDSYRLTKGEDSDGYTLVHVHRASGANENQPWLQRIETLQAIGITKIHCWMHSYDLDRQNLWGELETIMEKFS